MNFYVLHMSGASASAGSLLSWKTSSRNKSGWSPALGECLLIITNWS